MRIIEALSEEKYISGSEIGKLLGISRAAVHKQINSLKKSGYTIETSPKGYKLIKNEDVFNEFEIMSCLNEPLSASKNINYFHTVDSTQTKIKQLAESGCPESTVVIAGVQTDGYGRMKKEWSSGEGGLWFSLLLRPRIRPDEAAKLALIIGIALNRVLERQYRIKTEIKWPNDLLFDNKKICGIIIEMSAEQDMVNWIAAGIGINVNNILPEGLKGITETISNILNKTVSRAKLLSAFLTEFDSVYKEFNEHGLGIFTDEFNGKAAYMGCDITIDNGYDIITGVNLGIDDSGKLKIKTNNGTVEAVSGTLRRS